MQPKDYLDELAEQAYCYFRRDFDRHDPVDRKTLFARSVEKVIPAVSDHHHDSVTIRVTMIEEVGRRLSKLIRENRQIKLAHPLARFDRNTRNYIARHKPIIRADAELVAETLRRMHVDKSSVHVATNSVLSNRNKPGLFHRVKEDTFSFLSRRKARQLLLILG